MTVSSTDRLDVAEVLHAYAWAIDTQDYDALATGVFTADVVADYGLPEPLRSADVVVAFMRAAHEHLTATQHLIGNCTVQVSGDAATSRSYAYATLIRRGAPGGDRLAFAAHYADELVRTGAGWRIRSRVARMFFRDGNRAVLNV
ncbi:nuclear transport factor 2 family protein [Cryptosporangium minutisporangium]|uniref:SnoaL-like domain-containing protein n=1 Tax=Cryptosporangium minutisporangium TaxID=113569 RepID=A0ABP6SS06_9ACTN